MDEGRAENREASVKGRNDRLKGLQNGEYMFRDYINNLCMMRSQLRLMYWIIIKKI